MGKSFDDLLDFLLEQVAFCSNQGATSDDFKTFITKFYNTPQTQDDVPESNLLWSASPPSSVKVDRKLEEKVWQWLVTHPDIGIEPPQEQPTLTLAQFEALETAVSSTVQRTQTPGHGGERPNSQPLSGSGETGHNASIESTTSHDRTNLDGVGESHTGTPRIYASEERIWLALTGHGADHKRIPPLNFQLLSIIAAHGEQGIIQPDLTRISGQDKRSLPRRTDELHEKGYIEKRKVIVKTMRTSVCVFKRFAVKSDGNPGSIFEDIGGEAGGVVIERLLDSIMTPVKQAKTISYEDLRRTLGTYGQKAQSRVIWRSINRLDAMGCIKKVMIQVEDKKFRKIRWLRCVRFLKDLSEKERELFASPWANAEGPQGKRFPLEDGSEDEEEPQTNATNELSTSLDADGANCNEVTEIPRIPPQWLPDQLHYNFIFAMIEAHGIQGATSMHLQSVGLGIFWKRPFDSLLGHLTDAWKDSQPQHLWHLAIIRDTSQTDRNLHYIYRTYNNFVKAVENGDAAWDAHSTKVQGTGKKRRRAHRAVNREYGSLDEWGFPRIQPTLLVNKSGTATLQECVKSTPVPSHGLNCRDFIVVERPDGTHELRWEDDAQGTIADVIPRRDGIKRKPRKPTGRPIGRPRKYPKGQEPYKIRKGSKKKRAAQVASTATEVAPIPDAVNWLETSGKAGTQALDSDGQNPAVNRGDADEPVIERSTAAQQDQLHNGGYVTMDGVIAQLNQRHPVVLVPGAVNMSAEARQEYIHLGAQSAQQHEKPAKHSTNSQPVATSNELRAEAMLTPSTKRKRNQTRQLTRKRQKVVDSETINQMHGVEEACTPQLTSQPDQKRSPGVYINHPTSFRKPPRGRPRKQFNLLFKLDRLLDFEWFISSITQQDRPSGDPATVESSVFMTPPEWAPSNEPDNTNSSVPGAKDTDSSPSFAHRDHDNAASVRNRTSQDDPMVSEVIDSPQSVAEAFEQQTASEDIEASERLQSEAVPDHGTQANPPGSSDSRSALMASNLLAANIGDPIVTAAADRLLAAATRDVNRDSSPENNQIQEDMDMDEADLVPIGSIPEQRLEAASDQLIATKEDTRILSEQQIQAEMPISPVQRALEEIQEGDPILWRRDGPAPERNQSEIPKGNGSMLGTVDNGYNIEEPNDRNSVPVGVETQRLHVREINHSVSTTEPTGAVRDSESGSYHPLRQPGDESVQPHADELQVENIMQESGTARTVEQDDSVPTPRKKIPATKQAKFYARKHGVVLGQGTVSHLRSKVIHEIVTKCNGVFPGEKEIARPFSALWAERNDGVKPDRVTMFRALKNSIDSGKLRKVTFTFKTQEGLSVVKSVLTLPSISPDSEVVRKVQKSIQDAYPAQYLPPELGNLFPRRSLITKSDGFSKESTGNWEKEYMPSYLIRLEQRVAESAKKRQSEAVSGSASRIGKAKRPYRKRQIEPSTDSPHAAATGPRKTRAGVERLARLNVRNLTSSSRNTEDCVERTDSQLFGDSEQQRLPQSYTDDEAGLVGDNGQVEELRRIRRHNKSSQLPTKQTDPCPSDQIPDGTQYGPSVHKSLQEFDIEYSVQQIQILYPSQQFYQFTGTFSTEYSILKGGSHSLWIKSKRQEAFELRMPSSLTDILARPARGRRSDYPLLDRDYAKLSKTIARIQAWERNFYKRGSYDGLRLRVPRFVNLSAPIPEARRDQTSELQWDDEESEYFSSLENPPLRRRTEQVDHLSSQRKRRATEQLQAQKASSAGQLDNRAAKRPKSIGSSKTQAPTVSQINNEPTPPAIPPPATTDVSSDHSTPANATNHEGNSRSTPLVVTPSAPERDLQGEAPTRIQAAPSESTLFSQSRSSHLGNHEVLTEGSKETPAANIAPPEMPLLGKFRGFQGIREDRKRKSEAETETNGSSQISKSSNSIQRRKRIRPNNEAPTGRDTPMEIHNRLIMAVVVVRTLLGGLNQNIDWNIVRKAFSSEPDIDATKVRQYCERLLIRHSPVIDAVQSEFEEAFISAYEAGKFPNIVYESLESYDWENVTDWARNAVKSLALCRPEIQLTENNTTISGLPAERAVFDKFFRFQESNPTVPSKEDFFGVMSVQTRREDHMFQFRYDVPALQDISKANPDEALLIARSWIRANIATPEESYDAIAARQKLDRLGENLIVRALEDLVSSRVLRQGSRIVQGRKYELGEGFVNVFKRSIDARTLRAAAVYKFELDTHFRDPDDAVEDGVATLDVAHSGIFLDPQASSGSILAITNLLAHHRIQAIANLPPIDVNARPNQKQPLRLSKWGFTVGGHKFARNTRTHFDFPIEMQSTYSYVFGNPLLKKGQHAMPPPPLSGVQLGDLDRIPLWIDFNGSLMLHWWEPLIAVMVGIISMRPGIGVEGIAKMMKGSLEHWEIELALEWLRDVGAVDWIDQLTDFGRDPSEVCKETRGLTTKEWWWMILGTSETIQNGTEDDS